MYGFYHWVGGFMLDGRIKIRLTGSLKALLFLAKFVILFGIYQINKDKHHESSQSLSGSNNSIGGNG